eukprot:928635-Pyramimonas_sp.AAC.1
MQEAAKLYGAKQDPGGIDGGKIKDAIGSLAVDNFSVPDVAKAILTAADKLDSDAKAAAQTAPQAAAA